jgi:hypothetical protein
MSYAAQAANYADTEEEAKRHRPKVTVVTIHRDTTVYALMDYLHDPLVRDTHILLRMHDSGLADCVLLSRNQYELLNAGAALAKNPEHYHQLLVYVPPAGLLTYDEVFS